MTTNRRDFLKVCAATGVVTALPLTAWANTQTVRYGGSAWLGHYPAYLAMNEGYFAEEGIEQNWESFGTSSARMTAVMSGGVDIACTGIVSALALMARGASQFSIIAVPETFGRVEGLIGRENVKSLDDLKGKKIGVTFASSAHLLVLDIMNQKGLTDKDVTVLNVPAPELPAAMQAGQIDAAAAWTPQFDHILRQEGATLLADDTAFSLYDSHQVTPGPDVLVVRRAFAEKNPEAVKAYLRAYFKACEFLRDEPDEAAEKLLSLTNIDLDDQLAAVKGADWFDAAKQDEMLNGPFIDGLQELAEMLVRYKQIDKAPTVKDWVDSSFI